MDPNKMPPSRKQIEKKRDELVEFQHSYGLAMQLMIKVDSQQQNYYWQKIMHLAKITEEEENERKMMESSSSANSNDGDVDDDQQDQMMNDFDTDKPKTKSKKSGIKRKCSPNDEDEHNESHPSTSH